MVLYRALMHINEPGKSDLVLNELENLIQDMEGESLEVELLANSDGVLLYLKQPNPRVDRLTNLRAHGVRFTVCSHSLQTRAISREMLLPIVEIVNSGVGEIVRRQTDGYAYIKL